MTPKPQDPAGNVTSVTSVAGTTTYALDAAERLTSLAAPQGVAVWEYNPYNGLPAQMSLTNVGLTATYQYGVMDQLTNIVWRNAESNVLAGFVYRRDATLMITQKVAQVGEQAWTESYTLDAMDRLIGEKCVSGTKTLYDVGYNFDAAGNRTSKTRGAVAVSCTYSNGCNRLLGWAATSSNAFADILTLPVSGSSSETIGTNANLGQLYVSNSVSGVKATPTVAATAFALTSYPLPLGASSLIAAIGDAAGNVGWATNAVSVNVFTNAGYGMNAAGCVTSIQYHGTSITQTVDLTWNGQYQITAVKTNGVVVEAYGYDAQGRRIWISDGATTNFLVYNGPHVVAELDATGSLTRSYLWGPGIDHLLAVTVYSGGTGATYYALTDHLGTVHALADSSGNIVERYRFDAWGRVLGVFNSTGTQIPESAIGNRYLWQGREYSWATGLYFFRARWYDPVTGRWLSNDPTGISGGLNQYVFCRNNPVNFVDPFGLCEEFVRTARSYLLSDQWATWRWNSWRFRTFTPKCNEFVYDVILRAGLPDPALPSGAWLRGPRPPTAREWVDPGVDIPGWSAPHERPLVGDVVSDGSHVGIKTGEDTIISASSEVNRVREVGRDVWKPRYGRSPLRTDVSVPEQGVLSQ